MEEYFITWDADLVKPNTNKEKLFRAMLEKLDESSKDVDICWRLVEACLVVGDSFEKVKKKSEAKKWAEESLKYAKMAVETDSGSMQAHKFYCAAVGRMSDYVAIKEKIKLGHEFKEHRDIAVELDSNDKLMHHMYGRWCYEVASLSFFERKIAEMFFATPPSSSYSEALESLLKADKISRDWKANKMWMAKVHIAMKHYDKAIKAIDAGLALPIETEEDAVSENLLKDMEYSYSGYRK